MPQFQNQRDQETMLMQGINIHKPENQLKCLSREGLMPDNTEMIHITKKSTMNADTSTAMKKKEP